MPATSSAVAANAADESTPLLRDAPGVNGVSEAGPSSTGDVEGAGDGQAAAEPEGIPDVAARMHLLFPAIGIGVSSLRGLAGYYENEEEQPWEGELEHREELGDDGCTRLTYRGTLPF